MEPKIEMTFLVGDPQEVILDIPEFVQIVKTDVTSDLSSFGGVAKVGDFIFLQEKMISGAKGSRLVWKVTSLKAGRSSFPKMKVILKRSNGEIFETVTPDVTLEFAAFSMTSARKEMFPWVKTSPPWGISFLYLLLFFLIGSLIYRGVRRFLKNRFIRIHGQGVDSLSQSPQAIMSDRINTILHSLKDDSVSQDQIFEVSECLREIMILKGARLSRGLTSQEWVVAVQNSPEILSFLEPLELDLFIQDLLSLESLKYHSFSDKVVEPKIDLKLILKRWSSGFSNEKNEVPQNSGPMR